MFNLEQAIGEWRRQMASAALKSDELLAELESHLREELDAQLRAGVALEPAFRVAVRSLGTPQELGKEFAKSTPLHKATSRKFLWGFYYACAAVALLIEVWTLLLFELSALQRGLASVGIALFAAYVLALPFLPWWRSAASAQLLHRVLKAAGLVVLLWSACALLAALRLIQLPIGIVAEMAAWSFCAAYGLTSLACILNTGCGSPNYRNWFSRLLGPRTQLPPCESFNQAAQTVLEMARLEASALGHDYVGTEHVLLAAVKTAQETLSPILQRHRLSADSILGEIRRLICAGQVRTLPSVIPFTPRARKALQLAGYEAGSGLRPVIGAEHIFLGLLLEGTGVAALALKNLGVQSGRLRAEISGA